MSAMPIRIPISFPLMRVHSSFATVEDSTLKEAAAPTLALSVAPSPALPITVRAVSAIWDRAFREFPAYEGKDDINHRLFLVTNEENHDNTLLQLMNVPQTGSLLLSNSGMMTLNLFAAREQSHKMHVLLIDCSRRVQHFWNQFQKLIVQVSVYTEFGKALIASLKRDKEIYYGGDPRGHTASSHLYLQLKMWAEELRSDSSWCHSNDLFQKVRLLFLENRFHFKLGDWSSPELITATLTGIKTSGLFLDTVVQNNIGEYCENQGEEFFHRYRTGMARLLQPTTWIVNTKTRDTLLAPLIQQAVLCGSQTVESLFPASLK